ncbi:MAG TPA: hypothetical protein VM843_00510 [Flavisolibacter sp.]|nr:hypothetical protein [Flavisolibacter sp.]
MTPLLLLLASMSQPLPAQGDTTPLRSKTYAVFVNKGVPTAHKGYLQGIDETSLRITGTPAPFGNTRLSKTVSYTEIDRLTVRRTGDTRQGASIGALTGVLLGSVVGAITYTPCAKCLIDFGQGLNIGIGALTGAGAGLGLGIALGSVKQRFTINRTKDSFDAMRSGQTGNDFSMLDRNSGKHMVSN